MINKFYDRLKWIFYGRVKILSGVDGHWSSYCCNVVFGGSNFVGRRVKIFDSKVGKYSYFAADTCVNNARIGMFCSIGHEVIIGGMGFHDMQKISTHPSFFGSKLFGNFVLYEKKFHEEKVTIIGRDVWIGARVIVMNGVTVGDGSVVAAGSVVTKNVEPYTVVGGVPAKLIKKRFCDQNKESIIKNSRWNFCIPEELTEMALRINE